MVPFLKSVAKAYCENVDVFNNIAFVFPNRRSGKFFEKYISEQFGTRTFMPPEIMTISELISDYTHTIEASRMEQLFALYSAYRKLAEDAMSFDQFVYWGDMVLSDFNDIDRYLVDAESLFKNVKSIKELSSDFLSEEQKKVISEFWGIVFNEGESDGLWNKNIWENKASDTKKKFVKLWEILYPLYLSFNKIMSDRGLSYSGKSYRLAAEKIAHAKPEDFSFSRIVFVGFSTLSKSEKQIFNYFRNSQLGDFYWDFDEDYPAFKDTQNKGTWFLQEYVRDYPSAFELEKDERKEKQNIQIMSVPSGGGQAKVAGEIVKKLKEDDPNFKEIETAVVLPEEIYLNSVVYSMPDCINSLNVTMGYPMRNTAVASLMSMLSKLHTRKRQIKGEISYYYDDLEALLSHPYVKQIGGETIDVLKKEIIDSKYFFVPQKLVLEKLPDLKLIFSHGSLDRSDEILNYVSNIVNNVLETIDVEDVESQKFEIYYLRQYQNSLTQMSNVMEAYDEGKTLMMGAKTFFLLLDRLLSACNIPFEGEPLDGLQVMGVLETRLLDFENIIILSMNEKVFPTKHFAKSFIPMSLRKSYGLSTMDLQDAMYAYYFYRMICRAKNVFLLYDSRSNGVSSGEQSRYIYQLQRLYCGEECKKTNWEYNISLPQKRTLEIKKTEAIQKKLQAYTVPGSDKNFSASALNTYINCPMRFYLETIEGLREEEEISEFIDSRTFGTIVHRVLEQVFNHADKTVTSDYLDVLLNESDKKVNLDKIIVDVIASEYDNLAKNAKIEELDGDTALVFKTVKYYVKAVLKHDKKIAPFDYLGSEYKRQIRLKLEDGKEVNFKFAIDRIDRLPLEKGGQIRIIDYKTGSDDMTVPKNLNDLFDASKGSSRKKAVVQLLLYCYAYEQEQNMVGKLKLQPIIYKLREIKKYQESGFALTYSRKDLTDFRELENGYTGNGGQDISFMQVITNYINEILSPDVPFRQSVSNADCAFCPFKDICGRI